MKHLEIVRALHGRAAVQTFINGRLIAISLSMPLVKARMDTAATGLPVVDHMADITK
jgi:hypothetical protein